MLLSLLLLSGCDRFAARDVALPEDLDVTSEEFIDKLGHYGALVQFLHSREMGSGLMGEVDHWYFTQMDPETARLDYTARYQMAIDEEGAYTLLALVEKRASEAPSFGEMDERAKMIVEESRGILSVLRALSDLFAIEPIDEASAEELARRLENDLLRMQPGVVEFSDHVENLREQAREQRMMVYREKGENAAADILEMEYRIHSLMKSFDGIDAQTLDALNSLRLRLVIMDGEDAYCTYLDSVDMLLSELQAWVDMDVATGGEEAFLFLWTLYETSVQRFNELRL